MQISSLFFMQGTTHKKFKQWQMNKGNSEGKIRNDLRPKMLPAMWWMAVPPSKVRKRHRTGTEVREGGPIPLGFPPTPWHIPSIWMQFLEIYKFFIGFILIIHLKCYFLTEHAPPHSLDTKMQNGQRKWRQTRKIQGRQTKASIRKQMKRPKNRLGTLFEGWNLNFPNF